MPKLWTDTIDAHRRIVGDAILDATATLVGEQGVASVTMSAIAERAGIGRATLYKYYPDVEQILLAWHERQVDQHLSHLVQIGTGDPTDDPGARLEVVLTAYAMIRLQHEDGEAIALLHRADHLARAHQSLHDFIQALISAAVQSGDVRDDVSPSELATYSLHALAAAGSLHSAAAARRLVAVTLAGLRSRPARHE